MEWNGISGAATVCHCGIFTYNSKKHLQEEAPSFFFLFLSFLAKRDASGKYDKSGIPTINHTNPACTTCQVKFNLWSLMLIYKPLFNIRLISTIVQEE